MIIKYETTLKMPKILLLNCSFSCDWSFSCALVIAIPVLSVNSFAEAWVTEVIWWAVLAFVALSDDGRGLTAMTSRSSVAKFVACSFHQFVLGRSVFLRFRYSCLFTNAHVHKMVFVNFEKKIKNSLSRLIYRKHLPHLLKCRKRSKVFPAEGAFHWISLLLGSCHTRFSLMLRPHFHTFDMYWISATKFTVCQR